jgi:hypothetical protein
MHGEWHARHRDRRRPMDRGDFAVIPIFVSVTPDRTLTRHDGVFFNA